MKKGDQVASGNFNAFFEQVVFRVAQFYGNNYICVQVLIDHCMQTTDLSLANLPGQWLNNYMEFYDVGAPKFSSIPKSNFQFALLRTLFE